MRAHDCRVDHLQRRIGNRDAAKRLQDGVPNPGLRPAAELPPDGVPIAELRRQVTPRRASAHDPEDRVEDLAMVARPTTAFRDQKGSKNLPLGVRHEIANHRCSP